MYLILNTLENFYFILSKTRVAETLLPLGEVMGILLIICLPFDITYRLVTVTIPFEFLVMIKMPPFEVEYGLHFIEMNFPFIFFFF